MWSLNKTLQIALQAEFSNAALVTERASPNSNELNKAEKLKLQELTMANEKHMQIPVSDYMHQVNYIRI